MEKRIPCVVTRMDGDQNEEFVQCQRNGAPWVVINLGEDIEEGVPEWALTSIAKKEYSRFDKKGRLRKGFPKKLYKIDYLNSEQAPEPTEEERLKKLSRGELMREWRKKTGKTHKEGLSMKNPDMVDELK